MYENKRKSTKKSNPAATRRVNKDIEDIENSTDERGVGAIVSNQTTKKKSTFGDYMDHL